MNYEELLKDVEKKIDNLNEQIISLQKDKKGLIAYIKKLRNIHKHDENEIKKLKEACEMLNENIKSMNVTVSQNDIAYYKMLEQNAFLAGQVKTYQQFVKTDTNDEDG